MLSPRRRIVTKIPPVMNDMDKGLDERMASVFEPDILTPSQYFDRVRRRLEHDGERMLMLAVLEDAVNAYQKNVGAQDARRQEAFSEAEAWLEDHDRSWLFSFESICDVLGLEPDYLRRGLRAWKERTHGGERRPASVTELRDTDETEQRRTANGD